METVQQLSSPLFNPLCRANFGVYNGCMVLKLSISTEVEAELKAKASAAGVDVETYAAGQLERMVAPPRGLREISGPAYDEFLASGMSDDELGDLLENAKHDMRAERRRTQEQQRSSSDQQRKAS